jgi:hypothetical protein
VYLTSAEAAISAFFSFIKIKNLRVLKHLSGFKSRPGHHRVNDVNQSSRLPGNSRTFATADNGLMIPTLKIERGALEGRHQAFVDNWGRHNSPAVRESAP